MNTWLKGAGNAFPSARDLLVWVVALVALCVNAYLFFVPLFEKEVALVKWVYESIGKKEQAANRVLAKPPIQEAEMNKPPVSGPEKQESLKPTGGDDVPFKIGDLPPWQAFPPLWPPAEIKYFTQPPTSKIAHNDKRGVRRNSNYAQKQVPRYYLSEEIPQGDLLGFFRQIKRRQCIENIDWPLVCSEPEENRNTTIYRRWMDWRN